MAGKKADPARLPSMNYARGDRHGGVKIPDHLVAVIKAEYVKGSRTHGLKALARKYGVSLMPIHDIVKSRRHGHD